MDRGSCWWRHSGKHYMEQKHLWRDIAPLGALAHRPGSVSPSLLKGLTLISLIRLAAPIAFVLALPLAEIIVVVEYRADAASCQPASLPTHLLGYLLHQGGLARAGLSHQQHRLVAGGSYSHPLHVAQRMPSGGKA